MRCATPLSVLLIPVLSLLAFAPVREAAALATVCVNNPALLQSALTNAQSNNDDNYIKVVTGSYGLIAPGNITIPASHSLTIEGGYAAGCGSAPTATPYFTTIAGGSGVSLRINVTDGTLTMRNLTLSGFQPPAGTTAITLYQNGYGGTLHVENVNVTGNTVASANDDILFVNSQGGLVFDDNIVHDNPNARSAVHIYGLYSSLPFAVANNTVVNNAGRGLYFDVYTSLPSGLYNNILWHNGIDDLVVGNVIANTPPLALNNTWVNCNGCGSLAAVSANNGSADPLLTANYHPGSGSPAANAGVPLPLVLPATDANGAARVVGSAPDQGAFEGTADDLATNTWAVLTNADDGSVASLRGAINGANATGKPARITFSSVSAGHGCPMEIDLATPLPVITVPMVIDGYADPNSAVNTAAKDSSSIPFNATLCTLLVNTGAATNSAFSVASSAPASQHLEVRGVRFANFGTAVNLAGGNGHWIHGNAFAAASLAVVGNSVGVGISGGQADVVGGNAVADVNLIGASTGTAGVLVQGLGGFHTILNNNVGGDPAADLTTTAYASAQNGIELLNAARDTVTGNMIFLSGSNGILLDNASFSVITGNGIGFGGSASGTTTNVPGVRVSSGSFDNFIGATSGTASNAADIVVNVIGDNSGPGVWIDPTAGNDNQVVGNVFFTNGGLAIDLGLEGPTANAGSESSGPNQMLHKPVLTSALNAGANVVQVTGTIATEAPNTSRSLTLYASDACRGSAQTMLGTFSVQSGSDSIAHFSVIAQYAASTNPIYINATDGDQAATVTNTSEISNTRRIMPLDDLFYDGFDCY